VPHVGKEPRSRNKDGSWRAKNSSAGKKRAKKKGLLKRSSVARTGKITPLAVP